MGYLELNRLIFISAIIPLVCGICKQDTKEKFYESLPELSNIPDDTLTECDKFTIKLDVSNCADDMKAYEKNKYAFLKYVAWSKKAVSLDRNNEPHYGCTCKQVVALFNFAENTESHHIMCRYEDIFKTFCDFPRYEKFDEKSASVITNLKTFDSEFLEFLFRSAADLVKQYIMNNREVSDAQWPIVKTLNEIKEHKATYEKRHKQIMERTPATDLEGPNSPTVPAYMIAQITARSMELNFSPEIVAEIVGSPQFNSIGFAIKVMTLENLLLVPNIKNYVISVVNKFPSILDLLVTVLLPTGVSPYTPASEMQTQVREFVREFLEKAAAKQNGWHVELTQKALSFYCKMALRDLKVIYAKKKLEAEEAAAKVKAAQEAAKTKPEGEDRVEDGGAKTAEEKQQGETEGGAKTTVAHQEEQKDANGKSTGADDQGHQESKATTHAKEDDNDDFEDKRHQTSPTPEKIKLTAILESFSSFADNAALDKYIEENHEKIEETYTIVPDAFFIENIPLTCTYT